ncbi:MAG: TolC family protein [Planctomycetes bacterium]|nr:TolC family protein [Planctomycetota bacterium]
MLHSPVSRCLLILATCTWGCQSYSPRPLSRSSIDEALRAPGLQTLSDVSEAIDHPFLPSTTVDASNGIDAFEAACLAVVLNPELRVARTRRGLFAAQLVQAGLLPNPQISASVDRPVGGSTAGTVNAYGLGVGWDLPAIIEHSANLGAARAQDRSAALDLAWQEWQIATAACLAITQAAWMQRSCDVLGEAVIQSTVLLAELQRALNEGEATSLEVAAAKSTLQSYTAQLRASERSADLAIQFAKRTIGIAPNAWLVPATATHLPMTSVDVDAAFEAARRSRIDLAAFRAGYEAQEERVRAAVLAQFPRMSIGLNASRDTGDVQTIGLGVSIDLPIFDRAQGRIAIERATREQLFAEYVSREFTLRADLDAIRSELDRLVPEIEAQLEYLDDVEAAVAIAEQNAAANVVDAFAVEQARAEAVSARLVALSLERRRAELAVAWIATCGTFEEGQPR